MKKISICIPCYNAEKYIRQTLESVLSQNYPNMEIIVVDNCSTDKTEQIVRGYEGKGIRFYKNSENIGLNGNHNRCMDLATGDYINLLSADDYYVSEDVISRIADLIDRHTDVGVFGLETEGGWHVSGAHVYDGPEAIKRTWMGELPFRQVPSMMVFSSKLIADGVRFSTTNELGYGDDSTFYFGLMLKTKYICIDFPALHFRKHEESATGQLTKSGEAFYLHNKLLDGWVRQERFIPLSKLEKAILMGRDYIRVARDMPNGKEKQLLLNEGYTWTERLAGRAIRWMGKLPKSSKRLIRTLLFKK